MDYRKLQQDVEDGRVGAIRAYLTIKQYLDDLTKSVEVIKAAAVDEFHAVHGGRETQVNGYLITKHEGGSYDYSTNPEWVNLKSKLDAIQKEMQAAYKAMMQSGSPMVDEDTGEVIAPAIYKPNKASIAIKQAK